MCPHTSHALYTGYAIKVLCLIFLQNQVDSKPVDSSQSASGELAQTSSQVQEQQVGETASTAQPASGSQTTQEASSSKETPSSAAASTSTTASSVETKSSTPAPAAGSEKKNDNSASTVMVANYGLLVLGACLLMKM
ncbi:unnamed protein product [Phyllotreta striolata]|uniref:Uncharacterized protein n=1 Tax=Phyllotreta striolata TaxID=444603 RepID=A0A9N9TF14_PHYSR|nr:unnamed protein product [Phyllotreta striolata]